MPAQSEKLSHADIFRIFPLPEHFGDHHRVSAEIE
jgi:hypothetical protein